MVCMYMDLWLEEMNLGTRTLEIASSGFAFFNVFEEVKPVAGITLAIMQLIKDCLPLGHIHFILSELQ
eukprot:scaffold27976_cov14-Tisochrysis_lutea.AAC.2